MKPKFTTPHGMEKKERDWKESIAEKKRRKARIMNLRAKQMFICLLICLFKIYLFICERQS